MPPIKIAGIGAGGHGQVIADLILESPDYLLAAWIDHQLDLHGSLIAGAPVLGADDKISSLRALGITHVFIGVGSIGNTQLRKKISMLTLDAGLKHPVILAPSAVVSKLAKIAQGTCIFPLAVVNANSHIGEFAIINTHATVEHDCSLGNFVHIAPGAILAGNVRIGDSSHIGAGAIIKEGVVIGSHAMIGAGAVVISDVSDHDTVVGCPAKSMRS